MRVFGIGIDIVEINRIEHSVSEFGDRFLQRIYTENELAYCQKMQNPFPNFAARFAAKEAIAKALGIGIGENLNWRDMEILRNEAGKPSVLMTGTGAIFTKENQINEIQISLTHSQDYAAANAVALVDI